MTHLKRFLAAIVRDLLTSPPTPAVPAVTQHGDRFMALRYRLTFGPPKAPDVAEREMTVTENGVEASPVVVPVGTATTEFVVQDGAAVSVKTRDKDDAGNWSAYSPPFEFSAADTLAPGVPDAPSVELIGEE